MSSKMDEIIKEYYTSLNYYGYRTDEAEKLLKLIMIKYGELSETEIKEVLYNAMTSCNEQYNLSFEERLNHIDGLWFASREYAMYRSEIKNYEVDDLVNIMFNNFEIKQGDFLTDEEKEMTKLGIMTGCILISDLEKVKKKRL